MEAVYRVTAPIPEIGALSGDDLVADPSDPSFPLTLCRHFDRNHLPMVLDERVTLLSVSGASSLVSRPAHAGRSGRQWVRRHLRLVG